MNQSSLPSFAFCILLHYTFTLYKAHFVSFGVFGLVSEWEQVNIYKVSVVQLVPKTVTTVLLGHLATCDKNVMTT